MLEDNDYINYRNAAKLLVAGGRDFGDYEMMEAELTRLLFQEHFCGNLSSRAVKIVSGMAEGADTLAIRYADEHDLTKILFPANWKYSRRRAGFFRNEDMMDIATHLVAFWDGKSHGTAHIIELAEKKGIPLKIIHYKANDTN